METTEPDTSVTPDPFAALPAFVRIKRDSRAGAVWPDRNGSGAWLAFFKAHALGAFETRVGALDAVYQAARKR